MYINWCAAYIELSLCKIALVLLDRLLVSISAWCMTAPHAKYVPYTDTALALLVTLVALALSQNHLWLRGSSLPTPVKPTAVAVCTDGCHSHSICSAHTQLAFTHIELVTAHTQLPTIYVVC